MPDPLSSLYEQVSDSHCKRFGAEATALGYAPAVWSLIGESTDVYGGRAVMANTQLGTIFGASPRKEGITVHALLPGIPEELQTQVTGELEQRMAKLCTALIQRQLLGRGTRGWDITIASTITPTSGLGFLESVDAAAAIALSTKVSDINTAPGRTRLAETTAGATGGNLMRLFTALRGTKDSASVIDRSDGAMTTVAWPVDSRWEALALFPASLSPTDSRYPLSEQNPSYAVAQQRDEFFTQAAKAFSTPLLRQLPDAAPRVTDWLHAVHSVLGARGAHGGPDSKSHPSTSQAHSWLELMAEETKRAAALAAALRSRNLDRVPQLISQSHRDISLRGGFHDSTHGHDVNPLTQAIDLPDVLGQRFPDPGYSPGIVVITNRGAIEPGEIGPVRCERLTPGGVAEGKKL